MTNPLWLPEGSVRAIIALISIAGTIIMMYYNKDIPDWYVALLGSVVAFYFASKK